MTDDITINQAVAYVQQKEAEFGNPNPTILKAARSIEDETLFWTIIVDCSQSMHGNTDEGRKNEWEVWLQLPGDGEPYIYGEF